MEITLEHQVSDTKLVEYHFEVNHKSATLQGISTSYRNDRNDVWGKDWETAFSKQEAKELEELRAKSEDWDEVDVTAEKKITEKYNPVAHKTKDGHTYYSGTFGNSVQQTELPWTRDEVRKRLIDKFSAQMLQAKIFASTQKPSVAASKKELEPSTTYEVDIF